jgi:hypothetical protein
VPKGTQASIAVEKAIAVIELVMPASLELYAGSIGRINAESTMTFTEELHRHLVLLVAVTEPFERNEWFASRFPEHNDGHVYGTSSGNTRLMMEDLDQARSAVDTPKGSNGSNPLCHLYDT